MSTQTYSWREVREKLLGYSLDAAARFSGIERARLGALEDLGGEMTVWEASSLGHVYGIDPDILADAPVKLAKGDAVGALALQDEFRDLADEVRFRIVRAANAARDLNRLRELADAKPALGSLPRLPFEKRPIPPFRQGAQHAQKIRTEAGIGMDPIPSMRDFVSERFPAITVLYARLTVEGPAGVTFADKVRGPTIVLNLDGKNTNPSVRRFSLAHELYHVLADWTRKHPLATLSGYLNEKDLEIEQRANGFAVRLICPQSRIRKIKPTTSDGLIRKEIGPYGLHYAALRLYLQKESGVQLPQTPAAALVGFGTEQEWHLAEEPQGISGFPLQRVAPERRTHVARFAAQLHAGGQLTRREFVDALDVPAIEPVEVILDFFGLDRPHEGE